MKKLITCLLIVIASQAKADVDLVPLDMEFGYWEITTQINIDEMLANVPKEQRAMMRQMMQGTMKLPVVKQCITEETYKDMKGKMMESFNSSSKDNDCDMQVIKSTSQEFVGVVNCANGATKINITSKSINSKRHESEISTNAGGMGLNNIKSIGQWKSATCPDGVK